MSTAAIGDQATPQRGDRSTFVGRTRELAALNAALTQTTAGNGRVVMLVGEAGIGKTRTAAEFVAQARAAGASVLRGACYEGEWAPPYGPFAEALAAYVRQSDPSLLREELGFGAAPLARVVPAIRERLPDVLDPLALQPDEERFRLFDAISQFLIGIAHSRAVVLWLDDLHWADKGTTALLRHVARRAPQQSLLLVGAYRDVEVEATHPLAEVLAGLRRESSFERVLLKGLDQQETAELIVALAPHPLDNRVITDIQRRTQGNPFFVRETLQHLIEEGPPADAPSAALPTLTVPEGIRHVVRRRIERLSPAAQHCSTVAAAFEGPFRHDVVAAVAELDQEQALSAIDEMLEAQLIRSTALADTYDFHHALVRHTLYAALSPSRRVRLHRRLAETLEQLDPGLVSDISHQFHRSRELPGMERGAPYAVLAADRAAAAYARDEEATFLQIALRLLPVDAPLRPGLLGRLGLSLAWTGRNDEALQVATEAAKMMATADGSAAAANYIASILHPMYEQGFYAEAFTLARQGLAFAGDRHDATWAAIDAVDVMRREIEDPNAPGIPIENAEHREIARAALQRWPLTGSVLFVGGPPPQLFPFFKFASRAELDAAYPPETADLRFMNFHLGEYRRGVRLYREQALEAERQGRLVAALIGWTGSIRYHNALGEFAAAQEARTHAATIAMRLPVASIAMSTLTAAEDESRMARDEDWDKPIMTYRGADPGSVSVNSWYRASIIAATARIHARMGRTAPALRRLAQVIAAIEQATAGAENYTRIAWDAAETLWLTGETDFIAVIERNISEKVVAPDFRYPMTDGRLALARLCALQARHDEASDWFTKARTVLDEQGARPLRAIVDYDEALMYARRAAECDRERSVPLLEAALAQFRAIGMLGWIRRAEHLLATGNEWSPEQKSAVGSGQSAAAADHQHRTPDTLPPSDTQHLTPSTCLIRCEGDVWSIAFAGTTHRLKDTRGLQYLAHLFAHPHREFHVNQLAALQTAPAESSRRASAEQTTVADLGDAGEILDGAAASDYRRRLAELREDLAEAEANNDIGRSTHVRNEMELLLAALTSAGRGKRAASHVERARSAVGKRIRDALRQIDGVDATLGRYLRATVRTGTFCSYTPDPRLHVECEA